MNRAPFDRPDFAERSLAERLELVCDAFEGEWKVGNQPVIEEYLAAVPEPEQRDFLKVLLAIEIKYRQQAREEPKPQEFENRFSRYPLVVQEAFQARRDDGDAYSQTRSEIKTPQLRDDALPEQIGRYRV